MSIVIVCLILLIVICAGVGGIMAWGEQERRK